MTDVELDVLVVDDDDITAETVNRALKKVEGRFRVVPACDGRDGLDILSGKARVRVKRPYIVLLDLNMPRMNGFEFLGRLRSDPLLRDSVVFVLTTSDADSDRARAYQEQIAGYMVKSCVGPQFTHVSRLLKDFAEAVRLPD